METREQTTRRLLDEIEDAEEELVRYNRVRRLSASGVVLGVLTFLSGAATSCVTSLIRFDAGVLCGWLIGLGGFLAVVGMGGFAWLSDVRDARKHLRERQRVYERYVMDGDS